MRRRRKRRGGFLVSRFGRNPGGRRRRNIAAGFVDEDGVFHPIRASYDYDPTRAGEKRRRGKKRGGRKRRR